MSRKKTMYAVIEKRREIEKKVKQRKIEKRKIAKREKERIETMDKHYSTVYRRDSDKPRILAIPDVKGWTGWRKMLETKKHLSDQFDIDIIPLPDIQQIYRMLVEDGIENQLERVKRLKIHNNYDLLYFYAHTSLQFSWIKDLVRMTMKKGNKTVAIVTQKVILKKHWGRTVKNKELKFKAMSKHVDAFMINNLLVKPDLEKLFDGPIYYVPEGIDLDLFKPLKYDTTGRFVAAYAGKPIIEKGLKPIIAPACEKADVKLITNTNNFVTAIPYEEMVHFYNDANVYLVASLVDGGPNPALEAAACGRPIISNRIGNMPELIENGVNGYIVRRGIKHYVKRLKELKENPEKAREMGIMARKAMEREWSWEYVLNTYEREALWRILK